MNPSDFKTKIRVVNMHAQIYRVIFCNYLSYVQLLTSLLTY